MPDGSVKDFPKGTTAGEIAKDISQRLAEEAILAEINGEFKDLSNSINEDSNIRIITLKDPEGLDALRHSVAHLLAASVIKIWPNAKNAIGPSIENGFYQDFDMGGETISEDDFPKIEETMWEVLKTWDNVQIHEVPIKQAKKDFSWNPYKLELADEFAKQGKTITETLQGSFLDLCKGGHLHNPKKEIKHFKLLSVAGAYWRGNEKNPMLTRIYGTCWPTKKELDDYIFQLEEAKKRDHRKIGKELDLFSFSELTPGSPFFHPKGAFMFIALQNFLRELYPKWGYQEVITPLIYGADLWKTSGHWDHFREHMFDVIMDHKEAALKPMNCPSHILIYKTRARSYRDLPLRITDFAPLHRNELKGTLGGLMRVRKFSQDDCHVFCTPEQVKQEIKSLIKNATYVYRDVFGFDFDVELSTKPEKAMGDPKLWEIAENSLKEALEENGIKHKLNLGAGAFYGPKIDFHIKDALGRSWQCGTEQLDFQQPQRFDVKYKGADNADHNVVMLHRTVLGSIERFLGILIEHFAGKFPLWISPVQIRILTVADRFNDYANKLKQKFDEHNLRVEVDSRTESIGKKVREAQLEKIPLILTVGGKEEKDGTVAVRTLDGNVHFDVKVDEFLKEVLNNIKEKKIKVEI